MALLRFIYLTLLIYAGNELKTLSKEEKQRRSTKVNSLWRVKGDQWRVKGESKASNRQRAPEITRPQHEMARRR